MGINRNDDGLPNAVTYLFTDLFGNLIAELPVRQVSFGLSVNAAGSFSGTLNVEDPRVANLSWITATAPNKSCVWVDINGTLVYGGIIQARVYQASSETVQIRAVDFVGYLAQLLQAQDYSALWATVPAGAAQIAHRIISDALGAANALPVGLSTPAATPSAYQITLAAPLSQRQTVQALVSQLGNLGYLVGFDYACDVAYLAGTPTAVITMSYPRRGRPAGTTGLVVDLGTAKDWSWTDDGSQQAVEVAEMATAAGGTTNIGVWEPAMSVDGYPLLQKVASHVAFSTAAAATSVLEAFLLNDLMLYAYPPATADVTVPLFGNLAIGDFIVGDDIAVVAGKHGGQMAGSNPRFPAGLDYYLRIARCDVQMADEGLSTMKLHLQMPPTQNPQRPPI